MDRLIHAGMDRPIHCCVLRGSQTIGGPLTTPLVADLHVHYPMHVLAGDREASLQRMVKVRGREGLGGKARGAILWVASRLLNYPQLERGPARHARVPRPGRRPRGVLGALLAVRRDGPRRALRREARGRLLRRAARPARDDRDRGRRQPRRGRRPHRRRPRRRAGGRAGGARALRRGRLPPRRHHRAGRRERRRAGRARRRLRHARPPVLAPRGRQRAGDPVPARRRLQHAVPAEGRDRADRARRRRRCARCTASGC